MSGDHRRDPETRRFLDWPARLAAAVASRLAVRLTGIPAQPAVPASDRAAAPGYGGGASQHAWYWSRCGQCAGQTRAGLPCGQCGWLGGSITPAEVRAAGKSERLLQWHRD